MRFTYTLVVEALPVARRELVGEILGNRLVGMGFDGLRVVGLLWDEDKEVTASVPPPALVRSAVKKTRGVMGGQPCVGDTRIPVALLVEYHREGKGDFEILDSYRSLNAADLVAAWGYWAEHPEEFPEPGEKHEVRDV